MTILTIRMDRLGDVLLSLPALHYLKKTVPHARHLFAVNETVAPAIRPFLKEQGIEEVVTTSDSLAALLKTENVDAALVLNAPGQVYRDLFLRRVPIRFGMYSSLSSFVFLNGGVRQRRSRADRSEGVFNGELAQFFLTKTNLVTERIRFADDFSALLIPPDPAEAEIARTVVRSLGLPAKFSVVHPGMGGSALNLSAAKYAELLTAFKRAHPYPLVFSKGPAPQDQALVEALQISFPDSKVFPPVTLGVLRELFRCAHVVLAPSTGPLHLAHYVGTSTVGLFSPVRSHRSLRWRPWGGEGRAVVLTPEVDCPAARECLGDRCAAYPCMEKAHWSLLLEKAGDFI